MKILRRPSSTPSVFSSLLSNVQHEPSYKYLKQLEKEFILFLKDKNKPELHFEGLDVYTKGLIEKAALYYQMDCIGLSSKLTIRRGKGRMPIVKISELALKECIQSVVGCPDKSKVKENRLNEEVERIAELREKEKRYLEARARIFNDASESAVGFFKSEEEILQEMPKEYHQHKMEMKALPFAFSANSIWSEAERTQDNDQTGLSIHNLSLNKVESNIALRLGNVVLEGQLPEPVEPKHILELIDVQIDPNEISISDAKIRCKKSSNGIKVVAIFKSIDAAKAFMDQHNSSEFQCRMWSPLNKD